MVVSTSSLLYESLRTFFDKSSVGAAFSPAGGDDIRAPFCRITTTRDELPSNNFRTRSPREFVNSTCRPPTSLLIPHHFYYPFFARFTTRDLSIGICKKGYIPCICKQNGVSVISRLGLGAARGRSTSDTNFGAPHPTCHGSIPDLFVVHMP